MNHNQQPTAVPDADILLIYSEVESAMALQPTFWSNQEGWGDLGRATQFTASEVRTFKVPQSAGNDARWVTYHEALMKDDGDMTAVDENTFHMTFSTMEAIALRLCLTEFVRTERAKGEDGVGREFIGMLQPVRRQLLAGRTTIGLSVLTFALANEALRREATDIDRFELRPDVYRHALKELRGRFTERASRFSAVERLNVYRHDFQCACPTYNATIHYRIVIESDAMIPVEDIVALAAAHPVSYHEALAEEFYTAFGGSQRISTFHHGVYIKTIRTGASIR